MAIETGFDLKKSDWDSVTRDRIKIIRQWGRYEKSEATPLEIHLLTSSSDEKGKYIFGLILRKIYNKQHAIINRVESKKKDYVSRYKDYSLEELLAVAKEHFNIGKRSKYFDQWLKLMQDTGRLKDESRTEDQQNPPNPDSVTSVGVSENHVDLNDSIEQKIILAEKEKQEIEKNLTEALCSNNFGLRVDIKRNQYGWPEYHIFSKDNVALGVVRFLVKTEYESGVEKDINILEFVQFIINDPGKERVVMNESNMEKRKIEIFAQMVLKTLREIEKKKAFQQEVIRAAAA